VDFSHTERVRDLQGRVGAFMDAHVYPAEPRARAELTENRRQGNPWKPSEVMEELKRAARAAGLWNLFLPDSHYGAGLSNLEYAPLCELMGRSHLAPEAFNCSAPDTGNMEVLARYASPEQQQRWLLPLLEGRIRSAFAMTEPAVASSDATNVRAAIERDGDHYRISGRKWWTTGAGDPRCELLILLGRSGGEESGGRHRQHSMILVPMASAGVQVVRKLSVFGYDDAPHGHAEIEFTDVRVPRENLLLGEGRGFEIAQGRLGPGRIHHCMRTIGLAERALQLLCERALERAPFGRPLAERGVTLERIAEARILIDQARWLVLNAAYMMDTVGNRAAKKEIAMIKVAAPAMACKVIDWAIQVHGAAGVSEDFPLAAAYAAVRTLRFADGPDEVHREQIGRLELARYRTRGAGAPAG
jgi:acyl-CoA dehydrogenase